MTCQNPVLEITEKFLEVSNFLDLQQQLNLINCLLHPSFPWALTTNAVNGVTDNFDLTSTNTIGMFHTFLYNGEICSPYYNKIDWVFDEFEKIGLRKDQCMRARAGLFFKHPDHSPHPCHVDAKLPHTTAVYYVNECDGDLVIYNETYKSHPWTAPLVPTEINKFHPAQGKLVVFDGAHYHSSSYPTKKSMRLAITFNFLSKED
jgi:hypothetical protein